MKNSLRSSVPGRTGSISSDKNNNGIGGQPGVGHRDSKNDINVSDDGCGDNKLDLKSDFLRKHWDMIKEMKKRHRASPMRRRRSQQYHAQQDLYHAYLSDDCTNYSCSETLSIALDQLSVATPNWSILIPDSPGSIALPGSPFKRRGPMSPSFPKTIDESSILESEFSWRGESYCGTDNQYEDKDFSRLVHKDQKTHSKNDNRTATVGQGRANEDDDNGDDEDVGEDIFFDSFEIEKDREEVFFDEFFECAQTSETKGQSTNNENSFHADIEIADKSRNGASKEKNHLINQSWAVQQKDAVPKIQEEVEREMLQKSLDQSSFSEDVNEESRIMQDTDTEAHTENAELFTMENDAEDNTEIFVDSFSDAHSFQQPAADHVESHPENKYEHSAHRLSDSKSWPQHDIERERSHAVSIEENDVENKNEYSVKSFSDTQSLSQDAGEFPIENLKGIKEIPPLSKMTNDDQIQNVDGGRQPHDDTESKISASSQLFIAENENNSSITSSSKCHDITPIQNADATEKVCNLGNDVIQSETHSLAKKSPDKYISTRVIPSINNEKVDISDNECSGPPHEGGDNLANVKNKLNMALLTEEDKQNIDKLVEKSLKDLNTMGVGTSANISHAKSVEIENMNVEGREVSNHTEFTEDSIEETFHDVASISTIIDQKYDVESPRGSGTIDHDVEVPTAIKNDVKEIDDLLDDFLREMAAMDDGCDDDDDDEDDSNCKDDELSNDSEIKKNLFPKSDCSVSANEFPSDQSPIRSELNNGTSKSDFIPPPKTIEIKDKKLLKNESRIEGDSKGLTRLSDASELINSEIKVDIDASSFVPLKESRSRMTSPELNHSLDDNSGIFRRTIIESDATRPNDPVATALSRDSIEDEKDDIANNIQHIQNATVFANTSGDIINSLAPLSSKSDNSSRQNPHVSNELSSQRLSETDSIYDERIILSNRNETSNLLTPLHPNCNSKHHISPIANVSPQNSLGNKTDTVEISSQSVSKSCDFPTQVPKGHAARPNNPVATASLHDISSQSKNIENLPKIADFTSLSGGTICPNELSQMSTQGNARLTHEDLLGNDIASQNGIYPIALPQGMKNTPARPNDPIVTVLSQDSSENNKSAEEKKFKSISNDSNSENSPHKGIGPNSLLQEPNDTPVRPNNPIATVFFQETSEMSPTGISKISETVNELKVGIDQNVSQEGRNNSATRLNDPVATVLFPDLSEDKTSVEEANLSNVSNGNSSTNEAIKGRDLISLSQAQAQAKEQSNSSATEKNPSHTEVFEDSFQNKTSIEEKNLQNDSSGFDPTNSSNEVKGSVTMPQTIRDHSFINKVEKDIPSDDDSTSGLPLYDQGSVSTMSASVDQSQKNQCTDAFVMHGRGSHKTPLKNPRPIPRGKNEQDDPNISFISIDSPPPIPKTGSKLTEFLGTSASEPETSQKTTALVSNPSRVPLLKTKERCEDSPGLHCRARSLKGKTPHRIETSRSPLFIDRDGRSSAGNTVVSWYTSPGRSKPSDAQSHKNSNIDGNIKSNLQKPARPSGAASKHNRSRYGTPCSGSKPPRSETERTSFRSETSRSTAITYASPNRSMVSSKQTPLRGFHSLDNPPRSPALSLFSRMPRGARSAIRKLRKKFPTTDGEDEVPADHLSIDTVRFCTNKFAFRIHPATGPCDRCWALASEEEREIFRRRGSHLRIAKTRSGCDRSCAIFPPEDEERRIPVRLCRPCFFATHQQQCKKVQVYKGNNVRVRPSR